MIASHPMHDPTPDGLTKAVRERRARQELSRSEGEPSTLRFVGQIGVLGWIIVTPTLIGLFVGRWLDHRLGTVEEPARTAQPQLTAREIEVLQLIVQGKSNKEVAAVLGLSTNTVNVHRANLMQTLGIHNTAELVLYAVRLGLVSIR